MKPAAQNQSYDETIAGLFKEDDVELRIDDSAPGVRDSDLGRLFERFYRVEASRNRAAGGSGLGLGVVKALVQAQGGHVHAEHSPLGGLAVIIELPVAPAEGGSA